MMLFAPKMNTVFKSRWKALFWAAGVLATAYCTVPVAEQVDEVAQHKQAAQHAAHKNPWGKDTG